MCIGMNRKPPDRFEQLVYFCLLCANTRSSVSTDCAMPPSIYRSKMYGQEAWMDILILSLKAVLHFSHLRSYVISYPYCTERALMA